MAEKREPLVKSHSFGASGFTLGILSIVQAGPFGIIFSIVGFIFCLIQQLKKPTKLGKAGIILNIIGLILSIVYLILVFMFAPQLAAFLQQKGITA